MNQAEYEIYYFLNSVSPVWSVDQMILEEFSRNYMRHSVRSDFEGPQKCQVESVNSSSIDLEIGEF